MNSDNPAAGQPGPYTPQMAAEWLCRGGPCDESGDRCKVLSEKCCLCVYAGNLIARQNESAENSALRAWKEGAELVIEDLGAGYAGPLIP